jgi:hypothetical protein
MGLRCRQSTDATLRLFCNKSLLQKVIPNPSPTRISQLLAPPATFTDAAPSDVLADFSFPSTDFVGPAIVEVILGSVSVGWAALEPGRVHVGATVVSP